MKHYFAGFILCLFLTAFQNAGLAQQYEAHGNMTIVVYSGGKVQIQTAREFKVIFEDQKFEIRARFNDTTNTMTYVDDGAALYRLLLSEPINKGDLKKLEFGAISADGVLDVFLNRMPIREDGSYNQMLWLAYCSASYFKNHSTAASPVWTQDDTSLETNGFTMPIIFHANPDRLGLPREIFFLSDGTYHGSEHNVSFSRPYPAPFDRGFTNASYKMLAAINISGVSIPTEFEFTRYTVFPGNLLILRVMVHAQTTGVRSLGDSYEFKPPVIQGILNVHDYRAAGHPNRKRSTDVSEVFQNYNITNGNLPMIAPTKRP